MPDGEKPAVVGPTLESLHAELQGLTGYCDGPIDGSTTSVASSRRHLPAAQKQPLLLEWPQQLHGAGVDEDVAVDAGEVAKDAFGSDKLGQRTLDLLSSSLTAHTLKSYAGKLSQFAEFCHDSKNISPLEATTAIVVRYVAWIAYSFVERAELIVSAPTTEYPHDFRALVASVVNFMF
eukprot:jgi/Tetstr1/424969/TSEL_001503.t1